MKTTKELAWLGGLLEGEAAFTDSRGSVAIQLQMTDEDTIARAAAIFGVPVRSPWKRKDGYKWVYSCIISGTRAISWMMTLYQFFGERRQARIRQIIETWKAKNYAPRAPRGQRFMAVCHPDKPRQGGMLCNTCYMRAWRFKTGRDKAYYRNREVRA